ncbi:hypothetical protein VYU27_007825 [Nannochloropsis oceanica]
MTSLAGPPARAADAATGGGAAVGATAATTAVCKANAVVVVCVHTTTGTKTSMMWGQKAKSWLQEKTQEIASKTQEVRQTRLMSDIEAHGKNIIHNLVAAGTKINEQEILYNVRFTPITPRVIGMAFPTPPDSLARLLSFKYGPRYMLWNLSEEAYDYSLFDDQ